MCANIRPIIVVLYVCVLVYQVYPEETTTLTPLQKEVFVDDDNNHTWSSDNYPQPYPQKNQTLVVTVNSGYFISVIIENLDLDSENGDYLIIKAGTKLNDQNNGTVFTYHLKEPQKYVVDFESMIISFCSMGKNELGKKGFSLVYKREGIVVTTESAPTEMTWPTPSETDHIYFTGNVSGKSQIDFENDDVLNNFKTAVAGMATQHCFNYNISFRDNITELNVHINNLISCPYEWPNSDLCVKIRFSVPIFLNEDSNYTGYELSTENLEIMWFAYGNEFLNPFSMSIYEEPHPETKLLLWLLISCLVLFIFIIVLLVAKSVSKRISPLKISKRRNSDTQGIVKNEIRASNLSLSPHPLQVIPPFFDVDCLYSNFEPDIGESTKNYDYFSDDESENEITITGFVSNHKTAINNKAESTT